MSLPQEHPIFGPASQELGFFFEKFHIFKYFYLRDVVLSKSVNRPSLKSESAVALIKGSEIFS